MCLRISSRCASFGGWAEGKKMECNILYSLDLLNSWINGNVLKLTGKASLTWYACTLTHTHTRTYTQTPNWRTIWLSKRSIDVVNIKLVNFILPYELHRFVWNDWASENGGRTKRSSSSSIGVPPIHIRHTNTPYMSPFCTLECHNSTSIDYNISKLSVIALISRAFRLI